MRSLAKRLSVFLVLAVLVMCTVSVLNAAEVTKSATYSSYSSVGLRVCYVVFTAEGNTTTHKVYNKYLSARSTAPFNAIEGESMWVSNHSTYVKANYSATHKFGIPTPWGTVGWDTSAIYLSNTF